MTERVWDKFLTEQDKAHVEIRGAARRKGWGNKPAIVNVDNYLKVAGDEPMPILEVIKTWPGAMGFAAWEALDKIAELLAAGREAGIPIAHVHGMPESAGMPGRGYSKPKSEMSEFEVYQREHGLDFMPQAAPIPGEIVLEKPAPSAFFGTPLMAALNAKDVDTLILTGESTSGCLRATCVDARSYRFNVIVAEECVYDRHEASHAINLFDMNQKYADVLPLAEIKDWLAQWAATNKGELATVSI